MAGVRRFGRRLAALPGRAKAALALAVVLTVGLVAALAMGVGGDGDGDDDRGDAPAAGPGTGMPSTTLATGGIEIDAPDGWQAIPVPDLGMGVAVPPRWEALLLSPEGLGTLSRASPAVPDFADNARAAAGAGGVIYAAGEEANGGVSDLVVRAAPETGVTDVDGLVAYAEDLAASAGRRDPQVEVVEGAERPTVRLRFRVGGGGDVAEGTETLVLGPRGIVWSLVVTSDDASVHDDLVEAITGTLAFAPE